MAKIGNLCERLGQKRPLQAWYKKESERHFKAEWTRIGKADILLDEIGRQLQAMTDRYEFVQEYLREAERDGKEDKEL